MGGGNLEIMDSNPYNWFKKIIPPFLLLPLVIIPPDLPSGIFWFAGIIALMISVIKVAFLLLRGLWHFVRSKKWNFSLMANLRPLLTIFVMAMAIISLSISIHRARKEALGLAEYVQAACAENRICPKEIQNSSKTAGALIKYPVYYQVNQDLSEFSVMVRFNIDSRYVITGGVHKALTFNCPQRCTKFELKTL